jgi:hypothetical protein
LHGGGRSASDHPGNDETGEDDDGRQGEGGEHDPEWVKRAVKDMQMNGRDHAGPLRVPGD